MQESGLTEIIPLICILTIWGHYPVFLQFPSVCIFGATVVADGFVATTSFVYCCSVAQLCLTLCDPMDCSMPAFPVLHYLLEFAQTRAHWVNDTIQPSCLLSPHSPSALSLSQHPGNFQCVSSSHPVAKVLDLQLQHQSFQWVFRVNFLEDWLVWSPCCPRDSPESSRAPNSKTSILQHSRSFMVQLSHPYMTTGKTIDLTRWTFVSKVMSLLFNMLLRLVIAFLPRSKRLLISWLQSSSVVIFEPKK